MLTNQQTLKQIREEKLEDLEAEIKAFEQGVQSEFWKILQLKWKPLVDSATGTALSGNVQDRGFAAGKANGLHYFLTYPEKHIKVLENEIKIRKNAQKTGK
jgi:hypothetical protein